ncbi:MAG: lactoylglutathione lyase [Alteromonadaceae bacterium]|nr:MAG: lactoylglutathione lyase [Alteromonadaceae bacterium]
MKISEIRPFVPSKDYSTSVSFYKSLGFSGESAGLELTVLERDGCTFFLQNHDNDNLAKSLMMQLIVTDIKGMFELVSSLDDVKHSEITQEHWGAVFYLWGPSGELWHVTELKT